MKKIVLLLSLFLTGCYIQVGDPQSSDALSLKAEEFCKNTPELDGQRLYCQLGYTIETCKIKNLDLRICGRLEKE